MMVVDRPQDGVAMLERGRVAVLHAEQAVTVGGEKAALDETTLPGQRLDALGAEDVGVGQVLAEVDAARPVLGAWENRGLDDGHGETGAGQANRGGQPRSPGTD